MKNVIAALLLTFGLVPMLSYGISDTSCWKVEDVCIEPAETRTIDGVDIYRDCWARRVRLECLDTANTDSCKKNNVDLSTCSEVKTDCLEYNGDTCIRWNTKYECDESLQTQCNSQVSDALCEPGKACNPDATVKAGVSCERVRRACVSGPETRTIDGVDVTKGCWEYETTWSCTTGRTQTQCTADVSRCEKTTSICDKRDANGECLKWTDKYVCPEDAVTDCEGQSQADECATAFNTICEEYNADGVCVRERIETACPAGPPPLCESAENCELIATECISEVNGLCDAEKQTYRCMDTERVCIKTETNTVCEGEDDYLDPGYSFTENQDTGDFRKAVGTLALAEALERGAKNGMLELFSGKYRRCRKPQLSNVLTNNCCRTELRDGGNKIVNKCERQEIELAAARRKGRATYIGSWCHSWLNLLFTKICLETRYGYCTFDSPLSRIIQEQGRAQLANLANTSYVTALQTTKRFNLYAGISQGRWVDLGVMNGSAVKVWQYPDICLDDNTEETPDDCTFGNSLWIATCAAGAGCGAPPEWPLAVAAGKWDVYEIRDKTDDSAAAISKYVVVSGTCDGDNLCVYRFSAWPAGRGGKAFATVDINWPMYAQESGYLEQTTQIGRYVFQPYAYAFGEQAGPIRLHVSTDSRQSWKTVTLPAKITDPLYRISNSPEITIFGACDTESGNCSYQAKVPIRITAKPWGSPRNPDCSGFTLEQISVLDLGKMDFRELASRQSVDNINQDKLAEKLGEDLDIFFDTYTSGDDAKPSAQVKTRYFKVTPTEGVGPFTVTLQANRYWPEARNIEDPVSSVVIDWGDGANTTATTNSDGLYVATHTYQKPGVSLKTHKIVVTVTSASGTHTAEATVYNYARDTEPMPRGGGGFVNDAPSYNPSTAPSGADGRSADIERY